MVTKLRDLRPFCETENKDLQKVGAKVDSMQLEFCRENGVPLDTFWSSIEEKTMEPNDLLLFTKLERMQTTYRRYNQRMHLANKIASARNRIAHIGNSYIHRMNRRLTRKTETDSETRG